MASASGYNHHRFARAVLKKSRKWEPSLTVQLYQGYWRFENSPINFQYDGEMKPFLLALRSQVIPSSLIRSLYNIHPPISFVDGCLVVEIQDFRRSPETRSRVVMRPAAETLAQTIDVMLERKGQNLDEGMGLELESRIIAATSPPLYLGTSILATRNATLALALTSPANPNLSSDGSPRSSSALNDGTITDSKSTLDKMRKLLRAGINDRSASSSSGTVNQFQPNWTVLRAKEQYERLKMQREMEAREAASRATAGIGMGADPNATMMGGGEGDGAANGEGGGTGEKKKVKKKRAAPAPVEEEEEQKEVKKPKKKKKLNNAAAEAEAKAEDPPVPAKKKKNAQKDAAQNEVPPPKKKVQKKKKDDGEKPKNDTAGAGAGTGGG